MAKQQGQSGSNGSSTVSDETLRLYLLCRLDEDQRLGLDERLLVDDELAGRVLLAESELTDDYAAGRLDPVERELFARGFLVTGERQRNLRFSSALQDYAESRTSSAAAITQRTKSPWLEGLAGFFDFKRPALALAGSFAVLILLVGLAWFIAQQRRGTQSQIARHDPVPTWSPQASPQTGASSLAVTPGPEPATSKKPSPLPTPAEPAAPAAIASFVLLPGAIRGSGELPRIALPDGEHDTVRLSLVLETDAGGIFRAELTTSEGQSVFVRSNLKPVPGKAETKVVLDTPARLLQSGDYQIKLTRRRADGQAENVGRYYFRALD